LQIQTRGKEPLLEYSQFHAMTSAEYLAIMRKKVMEKAVVKAIRETHHKEREENRAKKFATCFNVDEWASRHVATRSVKADFDYNWYTTIVRSMAVFT
jgi:hypothetical protein